MNDVTKNKIRSLRDDIKETEYKKENIEDKIESQKTLIAELENRNKEDVEEKERKQSEIELEVSQLQDKITKNLSFVSDKQDELKAVSKSQSKIKKLDILKAKLLQKVSNFTEDCDFFENNDTCPTCTQSIENEFRLNKIASIKGKQDELKVACEELETNIRNEKKNESKFLKISDEITKSNSQISLDQIKISQLEKQKKELQSEIQRLITKSTGTNIEYEKLKGFEVKLDEIIEEICSKKEELLNCEFIHLLLKDGGAKTSIIKKYIPIINQNLNKYLDLMEFPVNFTLDEEFNEKALNPIYEDFSYDSFSEGEKMRIDLALLFTWREVAKVKNSVNTNLLILDEVFDSSLDEFGTDNFTKIIKYVIKNSNVFVISHKKDELEDKFESILSFQKQKGFGVLLD